VKRERERAPGLLSFDTAYLRWRAEFAPFESNCFDALCGFVRTHFEKLIDRYYLEGHEVLTDFPAWAFERYLRQAVP
jgi:hypothetical protein